MASDFSVFSRGLDYVVETNYDILSSTEFTNGVTQKRNKRTTSQKIFTITFLNNTKTEIVAIRDYFVAREGSLNTFKFTEPLESIEYTVRFAEDSFIIERQEIGIYNAKIKLVEELNV